MTFARAPKRPQKETEGRMVHARIFELIKNPKDIDRNDCHTTVGRGRIYDGALVTMRLSGFGSAYAARGGDNGRPAAVSTTPPSAGAFFSPSGHRSSLALAAATMKHSAQRTSPTSAMSPTAPAFDGGRNNYNEDAAVPFPPLPSDAYRKRASISTVTRPSAHYSAKGGKDLQVARSHDISTVCPPCKPSTSTLQAAARKKNTAPVKFGPAPPPAASVRPSGGNQRGPSPASGDGRVQSPTPQNLRDNPERLAKVKTELCHYYNQARKCPWGDKCNYAHGKHELRLRFTTLLLMELAGQIDNAKTYLARPCLIWVMTGACPFGRRCAAIHDPSVSARLEYPSWLPLATAKTNAQIIVDRLAAHRENAVHQENPLIAQSVWENCRPSLRGRRLEDLVGRGLKSISDLEQKWNDTYALVCNLGVSAFTGGVHPRSNVKLSDLQKLSIFHFMRSGDGEFGQGSDSSELHRDYVFAPTHSLQSELCMVLQARYFLLLDVKFTSAVGVSHKNVVEEISADEFEARMTPWSRYGPGRVVTAHEVAFGPKGDHSSNASIWFDAQIIHLEPSQIKRSRRLKQKKKAQLRHGHTAPNANGDLISRTTSVDFPIGPPDVDPFVPMLPAEDHDDSHRLIMDIVEHRIDSLILSNCNKSYSLDYEQKKEDLFKRMKVLQEAFMNMSKFHGKWTWPKREGMGDVTVKTEAPPGNIMPYIPLKSNTTEVSSCSSAWQTFAKTIGVMNAHAELPSSFEDDYAKRLSIFLSIDGSVPRPEKGGKATLPHIVNDWWNANEDSDKPKNDETWKEILYGLPGGGKWEAALRLHMEKMKGSVGHHTINKARNMPLSTIPFVQG